MWRSNPRDWTISSVKSGHLTSVFCGQPISVLTAPVFEAASKAEAAVHADPRTACFYARRALELTVSWAYKHDATLKLPYQDNLSALIHEPSFKQAAAELSSAKHG
jgi:hypothetical protein